MEEKNVPVVKNTKQALETGRTISEVVGIIAKHAVSLFEELIDFIKNSK